MRIRIDLLITEFNRGGPLQDLILRYIHALITQISQSAACNRFHSVEERLCRWLLISHDRMKSGTIHLTQETLSYMLGATRPNVTSAAISLKRDGLIDYHHGAIRVLDRKGLERAACECYRVVIKEVGIFRAA
jgi:CRP-like cAMP-binding protein